MIGFSRKPPSVELPFVEARAKHPNPRDALPDEVVQRGISGDAQAQERILRTYQTYIRNMLLRLIGSSPDIDDLHQIVMMKVVQSLPSFRENASLTSWIGSICVHVAKDHLKWKRVRKTTMNAPDEFWEAWSASDPRNSAEARDSLKHVQAALDRLTPEHRTVLVLKCVEGYAIDEIATMTGAAHSTTRLRLYFARKAFAKAYAVECARKSPASKGVAR